jgi:tetratricopeptide (TPR) repeat protein
MAIDKSRTTPLMKGIIIFIALSFVISIGGVAGLSSCSAINQANQAGTSKPASASPTQTVDALSMQYTPVIKAIEASLTADPKNYGLLVKQAEIYFAWAAQVQQALQDTNSGQDLAIWKAAATYYARALAVKAGDAVTMGDYAVSLFYSEDTTGAIAMGEKARAADPKLEQNLFNLGNFYWKAGDKAKAKAAYEAYLALAPTGDMAQAAKDNIAALAQP